MSTNTKIYPFKFLDAYTQEDKDIFFGREEEVEQLYEMLFQTDLLLIYGASGTGKTSLIQCGLANKFKPYDWFPIAIRRKSNLNESIEQALRDVIGSEQTAEADEDFESIFVQAETVVSPLEKQLKDIYLQHFRPIYLIFDQFEELYVLGSKPEQQAFVRTVREIMRIEQPIKILLSIREEYLGSLYEFEKEVPELLRKKLRIEAMNLDKVRQVLEGIDQNPHTIVKLQGGEAEKKQFTELLFKKIQGEEKGLFIQLPYLQVFLDKLYRQITHDDQFQKEAAFSLAALQEMGDIGNVLRDFLEEQVIRIAQSLKVKDENIWKILSPFATLEGTKDPLSAAMLQEVLPPELRELSLAALPAFENARILRYSEKDGFYEVAHDTLAKQIAAKRSDEEIALLEIRTLIKNQLAFGKDLFSKKQLEVILPYLEKLNLNPAEKQLITESQAEVARQEAARKQRIRTIRIGVSIFIIFLVSLSIVALIQWNKARIAQANAEASEKRAKANEKLALDEKAKAEKAKRNAEAQKDTAQKALADLEMQIGLTEAEKERRKIADQAKDKAERQKQVQEERNQIQNELNIIANMPASEKADRIRRLRALLQQVELDENKRLIQNKINQLQ